MEKKEIIKGLKKGHLKNPIVQKIPSEYIELSNELFKKEEILNNQKQVKDVSKQKGNYNS